MIMKNGRCDPCEDNGLIILFNLFWRPILKKEQNNCHVFSITIGHIIVISTISC